MMQKYYEADVTDYLANPNSYAKKEDLYGSMGMGKCMPVGAYGEAVCVDKSNPDNLAMTQYNIKDRFGYLSEEDDELSEE